MILPDKAKALYIIRELEYEMKNPRNDGWTGSGMKKSLWEIKMAVDRALVNAPTYVGEEAYEDLYLMERIKNKV